jgi:hypothetical protein
MRRPWHVTLRVKLLLAVLGLWVAARTVYVWLVRRIYVPCVAFVIAEITVRRQRRVLASGDIRKIRALGDWARAAGNRPVLAQACEDAEQFHTTNRRWKED